jgi:hypothetical protein
MGRLEDRTALMTLSGSKGHSGNKSEHEYTLVREHHDDQLNVQQVNEHHFASCEPAHSSIGAACEAHIAAFRR